MTIRQTLIEAASQLSAFPSPELEARLLLEHALERPRTWLVTNQSRQLTPQHMSKYFTLIRRRKKRTPLAYLTHQKEFYGLNFYVDEHVLIPRPETEQLVETALTIIRKKQKELATTFVVADIGTGSGCIIISLLHSLRVKGQTLAPHRMVLGSKVECYAVDLSPSALQIARHNAEKLLGSDHNITFLQGSLLKPLTRKVDLILANLPYLSRNEYEKTEPEVKQEPKKALIGGKNGDELIKQLLEQAPKYLKPGGKVICEGTGGKISIP